jgi:hypothetical protein
MSDDEAPCLIQNVFSIGYRCNSCDFLRDYLKIRKYSSPFSYMVIDIQSALYFIDTKFKNFIDMESVLPGIDTLFFNKRRWRCNQIHKISEITDSCDDVLNMSRVCMWNHHNLTDEPTRNSIKLRFKHLLYTLEKKPETTLLFYIEKIQTFGEKESYFDIKLLEKYTTNFLILIPLLNFHSDPTLIYNSKNIKIIYFPSDLNFWAAEIKSHTDTWDKLKNLINNLYNFEIEKRPSDILLNSF